MSEHKYQGQLSVTRAASNGDPIISTNVKSKLRTPGHVRLVID
jgi:hypothetical protein